MRRTPASIDERDQAPGHDQFVPDVRVAEVPRERSLLPSDGDDQIARRQDGEGETITRHACRPEDHQNPSEIERVADELVGAADLQAAAAAGGPDAGELQRVDSRYRSRDE